MEAGSSDNWLQQHPVAASIVVGSLAGLLLQMSNIIDLQQLVAGNIVDSFVPVRLIDIGFRMTMGALLVLVVIPTVLGYRRPRTSWLRPYLDLMDVAMGPSSRLTLWATGLTFLAFLAVLVPFSLAAGVFAGDLTVLVDDDRWLILLAALVPGIWEELAFRGVVLSHLQQRFSWPTAIAISSIVFGLFHFSNLLNWDDSSSVLAGVIAATALGAGWGYLVVKTGSIVPAVVHHYLVDVVLFDELFIDPAASDDDTGVVYLAIVLLYPALTILLTKLVANRASPGTG